MKERFLKRNINTNDTYTTPNNNQPIKIGKVTFFPPPRMQAKKNRIVPVQLEMGR